MKKIILYLLSALFVFILVCVYFFGGRFGAYAWNISVFILAPLALVLLLVQTVILIIRFLRRKSHLLDIAYIAINVIYVLPITVLLGISPITYPTNMNSEKSVTAKMPIENAVLFGGKEYKTHAMWPSECYAFDILKEPYEVGSDNLDDYGIFGEDIYSPVSGIIIGMENNEIDIEPNTEEFTSSLGNYLYIKLEVTNTYLILAHLKQNSITVSVGDEISVGEIIGKVGNSGTTSEPHLHIQHQQDNPLELKFPSCAVGLPIFFEE
jgi:hypothetical protein